MVLDRPATVVVHQLLHTLVNTNHAKLEHRKKVNGLQNDHNAVAGSMTATKFYAGGQHSSC